VVSPTKRGAKSELLACAWLLDQGYEVFRAVHHDGLADIIAYKAGSFTLIDVKTLSVRNGAQSYHAALTAHQMRNSVRLLTIHPETGDCTLYPAGIAKAYSAKRDAQAAAAKGWATRRTNVLREYGYGSWVENEEPSQTNA
jgi:Holliday junction resolvase-like predicted endonuclease